MRLCFRKKAVSVLENDSGKAERSSLRRTSIDQENWQVGGRYRVRRQVPLWQDRTLSGRQARKLVPEDVVLVIALDKLKSSSTEVALVVSPAVLMSGWIALSDGDGPTLVRPKLDGSWEMKARYSVKSPATLRSSSSLSSSWLGEVSHGDEVLVLELGLNDGDPDGKTRLRAMVSTDEGIIGWLSPETVGGKGLLDPVNLLGPKIVEIHRKSIMGKQVSNAEGPRKSCSQGGSVPWEVGGQYRVLESLQMRKAPELTSRVMDKISACSIATVMEISNSECKHLGWCPCAFVSVDGVEGKKKGWVRCAAIDGHDLIDTRDQLEFDKIVHKLRASEIVAQSNTKHPRCKNEGVVDSPSDPDEEDSDGESSESEEPETKGDPEQQIFPKAPGALNGPGAKFADLDMLDQCNEDRPIKENLDMDETSYGCCTNCGVRPRS